MANILTPNEIQLRNLYEARRWLAIHLRDRGDAGADLLALTERGLAEAKELAREKPDATDTLFYVADASLGVALARESSGAGGWDEAYRVALLHGERLAAREPSKVDHQLWLGQNRSYFATLLDRDKRSGESVQMRRLALIACRAVLDSTAVTADQRKKAESCLKDLADAGFK